jgi:hypothetical protein
MMCMLFTCVLHTGMSAAARGTTDDKVRAKEVHAAKRILKGARDIVRCKAIELHQLAQAAMAVVQVKATQRNKKAAQTANIKACIVY